jgi:hypothetical protein
MLILTGASYFFVYFLILIYCSFWQEGNGMQDVKNVTSIIFLLIYIQFVFY